VGRYLFDPRVYLFYPHPYLQVLIRIYNIPSICLLIITLFFFFPSHVYLAIADFYPFFAVSAFRFFVVTYELEGKLSCLR
jgi:hypothetical protein